MKTSWSFVVVGIVLLSGFYLPSMQGQTNKSLPIENESSNAVITYQDALDQYMNDSNNVLPVGRIPVPEVNLSVQIAQSFIPTKEILTRVEVYIGKNSTATHPFFVAIREQLTAENLIETYVNPAEIPTENFSWVEFNFDDIWVTTGNTYYIVCTTENVTDNWYLWGFNNNSESYLNGCAWVSVDDGNSWSNDSLSQGTQNQDIQTDEATQRRNSGENTSDMCFRTYGITETSLTITVEKNIFGPTFIIRNNGAMTAYDVNMNLTAQGGFFHYINETLTGYLQELPINDTVLLLFQSRIMGLGPVDITATAYASNAKEVSVTIHVFVLFIFFLG